MITERRGENKPVENRNGQPTDADELASAFCRGMSICPRPPEIHFPFEIALRGLAGDDGRTRFARVETGAGLSGQEKRDQQSEEQPC
jgi:hypothetical protein